MKKLFSIILILSFFTVGFPSNGVDKLDVRLKMVLNKNLHKHTTSGKNNILLKIAKQDLLNVFNPIDYVRTVKRSCYSVKF